MEKSEGVKIVINNDGERYYSKWKSDTVISSFIAAPTLLIFYLLCTFLITGFTIKLFVILLFPIIAIITGLVYSPYFLRGKYINRMVKSILFQGDTLSITTFGWFTRKGISISAKIINAQVFESLDQSFFKNKKLYELTIPEFGTDMFYLIEDFFDNLKCADIFKSESDK